MRIRNPQQAKEIEHGRVHLSKSMLAAIEAGEKDKDAVITATYDLFTTLNVGESTDYSEQKCIQLLESGNVDVLATFGNDRAMLYNQARHDPHYCMDFVLQDSFFNQPEYKEHSATILVRAGAMGWEKTLIKCFEHPRQCEAIIGGAGWRHIIFRHDMPNLFDLLQQKGLVDTKLAETIALNERTHESLEKALDTGWCPDGSFMKTMTLVGPEGNIPLLINRGVDVQIIRSWVSINEEGIEDHSLDQLKLQCFSEILAEVDARWETVEAKLAKRDLQALDVKDLVVAGNMGDDALRQFMNPKHWRKPEDKEHLLALLEQAPAQVTSRISTQIEFLKSSADQSKGWGRA